MSSPNLPFDPFSEPTSEDLLTELEVKLSQVDGTVRASIVNKLRKMIDNDAEQVVKGVRAYLHQNMQEEE